MRRFLLAAAAVLVPGVAAGAPGTVTPAYPVPLTLENQRGPTAYDGSALGYKVGDHWQYNGTLWQAQNVSAYSGTNSTGALWTPIFNGGTGAADFVPGAVAAWSTNKIVGSYSGNDFILTRGSDSTTATIGFVNGKADSVTADNFCSANGDLAAGTCYVTTLYSQVSTACTATQATVANAPLWLNNTVNGRRVITFAGVQSAPTYRYMNVSASCSFVPNVTNVFFSGIIRTTTQQDAILEIGSGAGNSANPVYVEKNPSSASLSGMGTNGGTGLTKVPVLSSPAVTAWTVDPSANGNSFYFSNNYTSATHAYTGVTSTTAVTGGYIGGPSSTWGLGAFDLADLTVYGALTSTQISNERAALEAGLGTFPQVRSIVITDGDSQTYGQDDLGYIQGYPRDLISLLTYPVQIFNVGNPGIQVGTSGTTLNGWFSILASSQLCYTGLKKCLVDLHAGTNDIVAGNASNTTLFTNVQTYIAQWQGSPYYATVCYSGILPRSNLTTQQQTYLTAFNSSVQSLWSQPAASGGLGANCFIDWSANAIMAAANANTNTALYGDGLHPTVYGYALLASQDTAQLTLMLNGHF